MADAQKIVDGLGRPGNIVEIEPCTTRAAGRGPGRVAGPDEGLLKRAGAVGVMKKGGVLQVVVGPEADTIASDIEDLLE
jgi:PTS system N-acetylglucosamine-specific IIB component